MSQQYNVIGTRVPDIRGIQRVTGSTTYAMDIYRPGELIGRILRSPYVHAEIVSIDTSAALSLPGVAAVITYEDVPAKPLSGYNEYVLDNTVRYVGDEVAAVAAETEEIADQAVKLISVKYNVLPSVLNLQAAMQPSAPQLHVGEPGNLSAPYNPYRIFSGDVDTAFAQAQVIYENTYSIPSQPVCTLNRFACTAEWDGENLTVYDSTSTMSSRRSELAALLNLPLNSVRVIDSYMGGAFGEGNTYRYVPLAALLAMKSGRSVKMLMPAEYSLEQNPKKRHAITADVKLGANNDGTITAMQVNAVYDKGAYLAGGGSCPSVGAEALFSGYRVPNMNWVVNAVYTNNPPNGAYRGFGAVQPNMPIEAAVDALAEKLGMDPAVVRSMNCLRPDDVQTKTTISGTGATTISYTDFSKAGGACFIDAINQGKAAINWERWTPTGFATSQAHVLGGLGVALLPYGFSGLAATNNVQLNLNSDGTISAYMAVSDPGAGEGTVLSMMIAEQLGAKLSDISIFQGDTNYPLCAGQSASQTTVGAGIAATRAAATVKQNLLTAAAGILGVPASNLDTINSTVVNKTTGTAVPFAQIMAKLGPNSSIQTLGSSPPPVPGSNTTGYAMGACFAEVNVDTWTGKVTVVQMVLLQDWGKVVNPIGVEGQMLGGLLQTLGYALTSEYVVDKNTSQVITRDWLNYRLPTFTEVPKVTLIALENPDPRSPFGVKGGGEASTLSTHAAIANAIANATGLKFTTIPITPQMIIEGLKAKGGAT